MPTGVKREIFFKEYLYEKDTDNFCYFVFGVEF